ncbi:putative mutanase [Serendipita vermifera]|nr:putative mutanase [Serendipita vermifera]
MRTRGRSHSRRLPRDLPPPNGHYNADNQAPQSPWIEGPCLKDQEASRLLPFRQPSTGLASPLECMRSCALANFGISGLQNGSECWCGHALNLDPNEEPWSREADRNECSMPCSGDSKETCGGEWRMRTFGQSGFLDQYGFGFTRLESSWYPTSLAQSLTGQLDSDEQDLFFHIPQEDNRDSSVSDAQRVADKKVIAHHMIGNTYPYKLDTWISDMTLVKDAGIDGFALNLGQGGPKSWQRARIADAFTAAQTVGGFSLIFSFDMTVLPCWSQADADVLRDYLKAWGSNPAHLTLSPLPNSTRRRVVVSTFAGEYCTFGMGSVADGWRSVLQDPQLVSILQSSGREIAFVPSWFARIESRKQEFGGVAQGDFHWNGGWPNGNHDIDWETDAYHQRYNPGPLYMASISPGFFTHYGANSYNKNWIYRGDDWLYANRWDLLIQHRDEVDIVEIVTWNDYGESSYIGPIEGEQPNSQAWVDGYPHLGFLDMTSYWAQAYKTGTAPIIHQDKVYIWSRPHPRDAYAPQDSVPRPQNADWTEDFVWALVFATAKGEFTLVSGDNTKTFAVVPGVNRFKLSNAPGQIRGTLSRTGITIVDVNPGSAFTYTLHPQTYNFNTFMAYK